MKKLLALFVRQSPSMIVAMLALFVAMGGTAIAASSALITGKQIKNSSITGLDVKNKSLTPKDFRGSVRGPRGLRGLTGATGATGAKGDTGPPGAPNPNASDLTCSECVQSNELAAGAVTPAKIASLPGASAANSINQTVPNGSETRIVFNTELYDNNSIVDLAANNGRFTVNTTGTYLLVGAIPWATNGTGRRSLFFKTTGGAYRGYQIDVPYASDITWQNMTFMTRLNAGDYVELWGHQNSGGALSTSAYPGIAPTFSIQWLGP